MASKTESGKASKGSVQILDSHGRLQLRFRFGSKRRYLSLGLPDIPINRKVAEAKSRQIELNIISGNFDTTLAKYKQQPDIEEEDSGKVVAQLTLADLWPKFIAYKEPQCRENTMRYTYSVYTNYIKKLPTHNLDQAADIRDYALQHFPLDATKRFITRLSACCQWAQSSGWIESNPFAGMAADIKLPKSSGSDKSDDICPFTAAERDAIIRAIENNRFCPKSSAYSDAFYAPIDKFLFSTGCHPSEAAALQWKQISADLKMITFYQAVINTLYGRY